MDGLMQTDRGQTQRQTWLHVLKTQTHTYFRAHPTHVNVWVRVRLTGKPRLLSFL